MPGGLSLEHLIQTYGVLAVGVGTFFEGETILILGGLVAQRGYVNLYWVITAAFIGTLCGDQLFFFLGRKQSQWLLSRRPSWQTRITKAQDYLDRHQIPLVIGFRFLYGLRTVTPFVIGMSRIPTGAFLLLNTIGALIWAITFGTGGYLFGHALEAAFENIKHYEAQLLAAIVAAGFIVWLVYLIRRKKQTPKPESNPKK